MKKTSKIVLGSALSIAMCASLIAGSTFALFTSESKTNIAVTSGKVDVTAKVTALQTSSNAETDEYRWNDATQESDKFTGAFATGGTATYTVADGTGTLALNNIAPGDAVKFSLGITNESTISIKYQVRMLTEEDGYLGTEPDPSPEAKLSSVLEGAFGENAPKAGLLYAASDWSAVVAAKTTIPDMDVTIRLPKDVGNEYQNRSCSITLTVLAVQGNAKETSYCDENGHEYQGNTCIYCGEKNPYADHHEETDGYYVINGADKGVTELYIPGTIDGKSVKLAPGTFEGNTTLESVVFGEGLTELVDPSNSPLKWGAFRGCTNLTSVTLPSTLTKINRYSFEGCKSLKNIEIPASVKFIGEQAFCNSGLEDIQFPEVLETIDSDAFRGTYLKSVVIPDSVTWVGYRAFASCLQLESAKIGNGLTTIKGWSNGNSGTSGVFHNCPNLYSVELGSAVATIEEGAFHFCYRLVEVINHSSLTVQTKAGGAEEGSVGYYAAEIRTGEDATTSRITTDGDYKFYTTNKGKKYLVGYAGEGGEIVLPDGGEEYEIYNYAFYQNKTVTDVTFGCSVTAIGDYAFANVQLGTNAHPDFFIAGGKVPFREAPDAATVGKIKSIGAHAFENAIKQTKVLTCRLYIADTVESIGDEAFAGCDALQEVYIGGKFFSQTTSTSNTSRLTTMGNAVFKKCNTIGRHFYFRNTMAVWQQMANGKNVFEGTTNANYPTVTCNDGKLNKEGNQI